jgi:hypothetical protein
VVSSFCCSAVAIWHSTSGHAEMGAPALQEKERGLQFLEVQLEETNAELERRETSLAMREGEAADNLAQINKLVRRQFARVGRRLSTG